MNFTTALPDANYSINVTGTFPGGSSSSAYIGTTDGANNLASSARCEFVNGSDTFTDPAYGYAAVFR
jgi:hypothetical protein